MKAMDLPSGDQRGTAIWRPWRGPEISAGARMGRGSEFGLERSQVPESGPFDWLRAGSGAPAEFGTLNCCV